MLPVNQQPCRDPSSPCIMLLSKLTIRSVECYVFASMSDVYNIYAVKLLYCKPQILVFVVCLASNAQVSIMEKCFELITKIIGSSTSFLIGGDFNTRADRSVTLSLSAGGAAGEMMQFMLDLDSPQLNHGPSRSSNTLDLIMVPISLNNSVMSHLPHLEVLTMWFNWSILW